MDFRGILAESLTEQQPKLVKELQDAGEWQEYLDLKVKSARQTAAFVLRSLGDNPANEVIAREIALAQELELPLDHPDSPIPNEFEM